MKYIELLSNLVKQFFAYFEALSEPKPEVKPPPPIENVTPIKEKVIICPKSSDEYEAKFAMAKPLAQYLGAINSRTNIMKEHKAEYELVSNSTGVPWQVVAAIHSLEASLDFRACLHNGEHIIGTNKKTTLVPAGRGPFATWSEAAIDALGGAGVYKSKTWSIGFTLDFLERYNGLGYRKRGLDSPYLWNMSSEQRTTGKYIADSVWDPSAVSKQCGCVPILKTLEFNKT